jgi:hypothetical protein
MVNSYSTVTEVNKRVKAKKPKIQVLSDYEVRGYKIKIIQEGETYHYIAKPLYDFNQNTYLFTELSAIVANNKKRIGKRILKFDELISTLKSICMWKILEWDDLPIEADVIAELFIHKLIKLDKLMPFFLDESVNEIYLDQHDAEIYLDQQFIGRCNTDVVLTEEQLSALVTRIKLEHPISVSYTNPSLKVELKSKDFHLRISR